VDDSGEISYDELKSILKIQYKKEGKIYDENEAQKLCEHLDINRDNTIN